MSCELRAKKLIARSSQLEAIHSHLVIPDTVQDQNQKVMRHGDKINNLGRKKAHRVALLQNLASQLITQTYRYHSGQSQSAENLC